MSTETCWMCGGCGDDGYGNWSGCRECGGSGVIPALPATVPTPMSAAGKRWERHQEELRDEAEFEWAQRLGGDAA